MSTTDDPNAALETALSPRRRKSRRDRSGERELEKNLRDLGAPAAWAWAVEMSGPAKWAAATVAAVALWRVLR